MLYDDLALKDQRESSGFEVADADADHNCRNDSLNSNHCLKLSRLVVVAAVAAGAYLLSHSRLLKMMDLSLPIHC